MTAKTSVLCALLLAALVPRFCTASDEAIDLSPRFDPQAASRVSVQLDAGGTTIVQLQTGQPGAKESPQNLPMSVVAKLGYLERRMGPESPSTLGPGALAVRFYDEAEATIKVDQSGATPRLPENRRLIVVKNGETRPSLYCPQGPLTREQLDLIDSVGNSCLIDELLPQKPVSKGSSWPTGQAVMAALLTLDRIAVCEVQSVLEDYNSSFAKIRLAGVVHGTVDGAAAEQEVRGVYLYDRRQWRITRLNLAVREKRSIGSATPGLDIVAKLQIKIEPADSTEQLSDKALAAVLKEKRTGPDHLLLESAAMGFRCHHDRRWFVTGTQRESVILRRVEGSDLIAQCTLAMLPPKSTGQQTTLEQFQKDIIYSLGKSFGELVSARQWQNAHGHYCYEVVARGKVDVVPVEWHYFLVAREGGHRISAGLTIEAPMVDRLGDIDRQLIHEMELFPPLPAAQTANRREANTAG